MSRERAWFGGIRLHAVTEWRLHYLAINAYISICITTIGLDRRTKSCSGHRKLSSEQTSI